MRKAVGLLLAVGLLSGCATISGFQTGKTIQKNTGQIGVSVGGGKTVVERSRFSNFEIDFPSVSMEVGGGMGITDAIDITIKYAAPITVAGQLRYGFLNEDRGAPVSIAIGVGLSYWALSTDSGDYKNSLSSMDVSVPLYVSRDLGKSASLYVTPRYVNRGLTYKQDDPVFGSQEEVLSTPMIGGGIGIMFHFGTAKDKHLAIEYNKVQWTKDSAVYSTQYGLALIFGI